MKKKIFFDLKKMSTVYGFKQFYTDITSKFQSNDDSSISQFIEYFEKKMITSVVNTLFAEMIKVKEILENISDPRHLTTKNFHAHEMTQFIITYR